MAPDDPPPPPAPLPPPSGPPAAGPPTAAAGVDDDRRLLAEPVRQSPVALVFIAGRFVRRLGFSAIVAAVIFVTSGGVALGALGLAAIAACALLIASALSWWRFTFVVDGDELVVTKGILSVERLVIPLDRVQSVAIEQRLLHRPLGLVSAAVDTAGSTSVEFEIDAIDRVRAEALRRLADDVRHDQAVPRASTAPAEPDVQEVVLRRTPAELLVVGATKVPWAGLVALVPLIALAEELSRFETVSNQYDRLADRAGDTGIGSLAAGVMLAAIVVLVLTMIGLVLQIVREILANWNLTLSRTSAGGLRRTAGLLNTTSRSSTVRRIQTITTDDSPPQRWLGITHLRLRVFGANDIGLPGSRASEVDALRALVFGATEPPVLDRMISRWYVFRRTRNTAVVVGAAAVALWFGIGWWAPITLLVIPLRWAEARRRWRLRRWGLGHDRLAESYRLVSRHTAELPLFKAHMVSVTQSRFERRKGLATISVHTADGYLAVPMIDYAEASAVRDRVLLAVETDRRRAF